ncbi:MAG: hypothetical protein GY782_05675 [Gammaproteobacteria bacterium]|nr:hypothetical protein [Gammaproteobacteria bacterium]
MKALSGQALLKRCEIAPLPLLNTCCKFFGTHYILALLLCVALYKKREVALYWLAVFLILCPYIGFIVNLYPYAIPYKVTPWQAAAPRSTLIFMLVGAIIMLPILLCYTGYAYHIFRGKVKDVLDY